jgi:hypothetical protein
MGSRLKRSRRPRSAAPFFSFRAKETSMTVYLILVAIVGLIVVTIDDVLS